MCAGVIPVYGGGVGSRRDPFWENPKGKHREPSKRVLNKCFVHLNIVIAFS
jgi:hypothetical protein